MKKLLLFLISAFIALSASSQTKDLLIEAEEPPFYTKAEVMPLYKGGDNALFGDLAKQIKYPNDAIERNESGTVYLSYIVEKDGSVSEIKILKGVSESINKEAIRAFALLKNWKPGFQNGKAVRIQMALPIKFTLK